MCAHHLADFPAPRPSGIHYMLCEYFAPAGSHPPKSTILDDVLCFSLAPDLGAVLARDAGHGLRRERGVHMAIVRLVNAADQAVSPCQGMQFGDFRHRQKPQIVAGEARQRGHMGETRPSGLGCG